MATERWIGGSGVGFTWTNIFGTSGVNLNSMPTGSAVLDSTGDITNQSALDIFADFSFSFGSITTIAPAYFNLYTYYLNQDSSTYGDGQFTAGTQAAKTPSPSLQVGTFECPVGTGALVGMISGIIIRPGTFRFALQSVLGATMAASGNTAKYRTYNRQVA